MSEPIDLHGYLADLEIPSSIDHDWLTRAIFAPLGFDTDEALVDVFEDIVVESVDDSSAELHLRPGGWVVDVAGSVVRTIVAGAIVGGALFTIGADQIPLQLLPAVLPLIVDIERVRLDRRERELLIPLKVAAQGVEGVPIDPDLLYDRLDPGTRDRLTHDDFLLFVDRLIGAGELDDADAGDVRARMGGVPAWIRVTWR